jgi:hypothetical protein
MKTVRTKWLAAASIGLYCLLGVDRAAAAELAYAIIDREAYYGSSGSMCQNAGAPPDEMMCIATADQSLISKRLLLDFGRPMANSAFGNLAPRSFEEYLADEDPGGSSYDPATGEFVAESNKLETLRFLTAAKWLPENVAQEIQVTQLDVLGLHAEFAPIVARYVLWEAAAMFEQRSEGTTFWSHMTPPNGRIDGLRFYGEPAAVPEPASWALLLMGIGFVPCLHRRFA